MRARKAVDNHVTFDGLDAVAQREALRGGKAGRIADLEAEGLERGVQLDAVAGSARFAAEDEHDRGAAVGPARAETGAEEGVGYALVDDSVTVEPDAMAAAEGFERCAFWNDKKVDQGARFSARCESFIVDRPQPVGGRRKHGPRRGADARAALSEGATPAVQQTRKPLGG